LYVVNDFKGYKTTYITSFGGMPMLPIAMPSIKTTMRDTKNNKNKHQMERNSGGNYSHN
jgi:hypothetical protein